MKQDYRKMLHFFQTNLCALMGQLFDHWDHIALLALSLCMIIGIEWHAVRYESPSEAAARARVVQTAQLYLGCNEADGSHQKIVDRYNAHTPRARDYEVTYEDSWCAVFTSSVALEAGLQDRIPLECSCQQQILLFDAMDQWLEEDTYLPKPGDFIYYDWNATGTGDCLGWSDHVGIVVQTFGPVVKVIEGNKNDDVSYRYIFLNDPFIRGFGLPAYNTISVK